MAGSPIGPAARSFRIPGLPPPAFAPLGRDGLPEAIEDLPYFYALGVFPMGDPDDSGGCIQWHHSRVRAVFPGCRLRRSRSLRRAVRRQRYRITFDEAFEETVAGCADRPDTWISEPLRRAYKELYMLGAAHSAEAWLDGRLVGGVFGIAIGRAFAGESMFSRASDASKVALTHLAARLSHGGFSLFDAQVQSPLLSSLGAVPIPHAEFVPILLREAIKPAAFDPLPGNGIQDVLQWSTQTS